MQRSGGVKPDTRLDILRALAVLFVVTHHGLQMYGISSSRLGHFGVLIFFVHTSLVLMMAMERMRGGSSAITVPFYIQRAFRLYPLSILCVTAMVAFRIPAGLTELTFVKPGAAKLISNLLLVQNWGVGQILDPLWSLPFEIQMYLVLPFLFLLLARYPQGRTIAAFIGLSLLAGSLQFFSYYGKMAEFLPCFMAGVYAFWLRGKQRAMLPAALWPVFIVVLGAGYMAAAFPGDTFVVCLALGLMTGCFGMPRASLWTRAAHQIAKYSYGIYLVHEPLYWICFYKLRLGSPIASWLLFLALVAAVPFLLFHLVESPMIDLGKRLSGLQRRRVPGRRKHLRWSVPTAAAGAPVLQENL